MTKKKIIKFILLILVLAAVYAIVRFSPLSVYFEKENLLQFLSTLQNYWWGPVVFILIYGIGCVFAIPGAILTMAGGALFGTFSGTLYNVIASNLGATLAFLIARVLGRDFVAGLMKGGKLAQLDDSIERHGFMTIFRLRLIPLVPFNGLNFGSGFSKVKYREYLLGSILGMLPGTFIYTYFGDSVLKGVTGASEKAFLNLIIACVFLIAISFLPMLYKRITKKS
jgi:uncharacterized membrane protein YdjX (TVP38/TMEM64 family)